MRNILLILMAAATAFSASAADNATDTARWIDAISIAPIGILKTANIDGATQWGAGLDVGFNVNPFVGIHIVNLDFEGRDQWRGRLVDETDVLVKAKIARFSTESFSLYGIGGAVRDWNINAWGFSAGLGAELSFNKHVGLFADYSLRAMFKQDAGGSSKSSLGRAGISFSF